MTEMGLPLKNSCGSAPFSIVATIHTNSIEAVVREAFVAAVTHVPESRTPVLNSTG